MKEIEQIYFNDFGVAFHWRKGDEILTDKVQLVFKETGFYLTENKIKEFTTIINTACNETECSGCNMRSSCYRYLLKTPLKGVDLAVSKNELYLIKDLVEGTLFNLNLLEYLNNVCKN